ncbi:MAG: electron transfer flavoprotein subunit beta/FixA family protein [Conexivisphaerales archaeon]
MNIVTLLKHVYDENQLKIEPSKGDVDFAGVPGKISTFDRNAIEAALRLKQQHGGSVTALTIGSEESIKSIREGLAMGVDKAILIKTNSHMQFDALALGNIIAKALEKIQAWDLLLCAEGSTDTYTSLLPGILASKLKLPLITYARSLKIDGKYLTGDRSLERKTVTVQVELPAIVSVVSEINEPRIPTLLQILAASKKEVLVYTLEDLGLSQLEQKYKTIQLSGKAKERKKIVLEGSLHDSVARLVDALVKEGLV